MVLIDTWWNVNIALPLRLSNSIFVLIDTWWNVNDEQILANQGVSSGFNRYMVECESEAFTVYIQNHRVLIDTWWNVNDDYKS